MKLVKWGLIWRNQLYMMMMSLALYKRAKNLSNQETVNWEKSNMVLVICMETFGLHKDNVHGKPISKELVVNEMIVFAPMNYQLSYGRTTLTRY